MVQLYAEEMIHLQVECAATLEVKQGLDGYLRVIPITGGVFDVRISGKVISGGADWNTEKINGLHMFLQSIYYRQMTVSDYSS